MDVVHDALTDGRQFWVLTVVDQWSRRSALLEVATSMSCVTVGAASGRVLHAGPAPRSITVDHGTEFLSRARGPGLRPRRAECQVTRDSRMVAGPRSELSR